jgi:HNH endonuclease
VKKRSRLTRARLHDLLHYDPETGEFRWQERVTRSIRVGDIAGLVDAEGYRLITIQGRAYRAHHLAWLYMTGEWCSVIIDHRDGNPSNNCWDNLRRATVSQNNANRRMHRNNKCGYKGVVRNPWGRFWATIHRDGRRLHLGTFTTAQDAHAAYVAAARKLFGEFARPE